jgi:D-lactate dehydrogenase (cytochrome)
MSKSLERDELNSADTVKVPYSGGSSVEGHFSAPFGGVSVDFVNMNQILQVHADE